MIRISLMLVFCVGFFLSIPALHGQDTDFMGGGATIRGEVIEASPEQKPIRGVNVTIVSNSTGETYTVTTDENGAYEKTGLPAGRYAINVYKKGYGERTGKSKVVVPGGEIYDSIKMIKKDNIITFFQKHFFTWQSLIIFAIIFFVVLILSSLRPRA